MVACVAAGAAGCGGPSSTPQATLKAFLTAWDHRDWAAMARLVYRAPADFSAVNSQAFSDLGVTRASYSSGPVSTRSATATAPVVGHLTLSGVGPLTLRSTLALRAHSGRWLVQWAPSTIYPALAPGARFSVSRTWARRAPILGAGGVSLTPQQAVTIVGVEGQRVKDPAAVTAALLQAGATQAQIAPALAQAAAHPTYFEPVFTVTAARFAVLRQTTAYSVAGTVFRSTTSRHALTAGLAAHLVGSVGPITAEQLKALGSPYRVGDSVGQDGLEQVYERQLAGQPGATVTVVSASGTALATVDTVAPVPGRAVQTSIDPAVQQAAEAALTGVSQPAAVVAVRAGTGEVLASVSDDPPGQGLDYALDAAVPPGSTFKMVTSTALLAKGLAPSSPATCPPQITVGGKSFRNFEGEAAPQLTFQQAFALSCNTAFIGLATSHLAPGDLTAAAARYGIGTTPHMGYPAYGGSVPTPTDSTDLAATAIGQGRVLVSPLDMAMVAGDIGAGAVHAPRLVAGAPDDSAPATSLPAATVAALHQMMAQVVATGTAAGKGLPAGTFAKTGTAEFGPANPPRTHAWLAGFHGSVAFAVFVYGGGVGGAVAAPVAARFLDGLGPAAS